MGDAAHLIHHCKLENTNTNNSTRKSDVETCWKPLHRKTGANPIKCEGEAIPSPCGGDKTIGVQLYMAATVHTATQWWEPMLTNYKYIASSWYKLAIGNIIHTSYKNTGYIE